MVSQGSLYSLSFLEPERQLNLASVNVRYRVGVGQSGSFATGCRLWALLGSCSGTSGWGLNKAAISQTCQGALNLVCL